jgi:membrane-associated phospholipid phosphatase
MFNKKLLLKSAYAAVIAFAAYVVSFNFIDKPLLLSLQAYNNNTVVRIATLLSSSSNGNLWLTALLVIFVFIGLGYNFWGERKWLKNLLYITLSVTIAIILGKGLKYLLGRYRPIELYEHGLYGFHYLADQTVMHSSPSGHTLRIFSLMVALTILFRRYAAIFITFAVLVGVSRVIVHDHYPSDVIFGAYVGTMTAIWTNFVMNQIRTAIK